MRDPYIPGAWVRIEVCVCQVPAARGEMSDRKKAWPILDRGRGPDWRAYEDARDRRQRMMRGTVAWLVTSETNMFEPWWVVLQDLVSRLRM